MRRFRLRRLWRVNCEALVTATGQNLKRLLEKRGWGRRPFPAEAAATVPPANWEPDESPRRDRRKNYQPCVVVASLVARGAFRVFFEPQTSRFFSDYQQLYLFSYCTIFYFEYSILIFITR